MSRAINKGVAFDERTGFKTKGRYLREDGEIGILTRYPDEIHPQRYVRPPGPDGVNYRRGPDAQHAIATHQTLGPFMDAQTVTRVQMPCLSLSPPARFVAV